MGDRNSGWSVVTSPAELRELVGTPLPRVARKVRPSLHEMDRRFLAASPLCLLATTGANGSCDVSPKGDPPGFARVLDERTIAIPDRPGNRRVDGFLNVLGDAHVGMLFLVPGRGDTLRINGRAQVLRGAPFFDELVVSGHRPSLALVVDIEEVFYHCPKAFLRSSLWDPATWRPDAAPTRAEIVQALERPDAPLEELNAYYGPGYAANLYG